MAVMILKMSAATALYILLTMLLWKWTQKDKLKLSVKILIGLIYGISSVLSTHFGINYGTMMLNVRDLGPLSAGLFFHPLSGIIAGLMGGIERYIAGTYFGVGAYTSVACSVSTCLAGVLAALLYYFIFKRRKPSPFYALFLGAVMEVFHMYVVLITHRDDMSMAFYVVKTCSLPMIFFSGIGLAASALVLRAMSGELRNPFRRRKMEEISVAQKFQFWLFAVVTIVLSVNLLFVSNLQTKTAQQNAAETLIRSSGDIRDVYLTLRETELRAGEPENYVLMVKILSNYHVGDEGTFDILSRAGIVYYGDHRGKAMSRPDLLQLRSHEPGEIYHGKLFDTPSLCMTEELPDGMTLLTQIPNTEMYYSRDIQVLEIAFADIILFAVIYILIYMLMQEIVITDLNKINVSLDRITGGNLDEVISVRNSSEFASLSDDINQTVDTLKGYIEAAEKRIEQELEFARIIQESSLPKNFTIPRSGTQIFAMMDPAKEIGGDFYDLFFVEKNKLVMMIADVSGKSIPAALFMMRAKTTIRALAESGEQPADILYRANNSLCEGNEADMFVTVWIGIVDLLTGRMAYATAGHEYPVLMRAGGDFAYLKEKHSPPLACMEEISYQEYEIIFRSEDRLFLYTDGIPEAINEKTEQYGSERLLDVLNRVKTEPIQTVLPAVRKDIADFVGAEDQFDDITMLGFVYKA